MFTLTALNKSYKSIDENSDLSKEKKLYLTSEGMKWTCVLGEYHHAVILKVYSGSNTLR